MVMSTEKAAAARENTALSRGAKLSSSSLQGLPCW